jgi:two-component system chemotaxis response regulator CheB
VAAELDMQIVASLHGASDAIAQVEGKSPDVVVLDITMPDMDGLTALPRLLEKKRDLVVLMVSTLTRRNAEISLHALALGAADYVPKPETDRELMNADSFRRELIEKIRVLGSRRKRGAPTISAGHSNVLDRGSGLYSGSRLDAPGLAVGTPDSADIALRPFPSATPRVLLIGASTGGPQALNVILSTIGRVIDNAPVLITQHMPPTFTTILAEHLARTSDVPRPRRDGELISGPHLRPPRRTAHVVARRDGEPVVALRRWPAHSFLQARRRSVPSLPPPRCGGRGISRWSLPAWVPTRRGATGGGRAVVIAQDEASSVVWGMPGRVAQRGLASAVLPLDQIAPKVLRLFCRSALSVLDFEYLRKFLRERSGPCLRRTQYLAESRLLPACARGRFRRSLNWQALRRPHWNSLAGGGPEAMTTNSRFLPRPDPVRPAKAACE